MHDSKTGLYGLTDICILLALHTESERKVAEPFTKHKNKTSKVGKAKYQKIKTM